MPSGELAAENAALRALVGELEARLGRSLRNSDKPPSSQGYEKPAPRSRRERTEAKAGGQPGHQGCTLARVEQPDERVVHSPAQCGRCGASLA